MTKFDLRWEDCVKGMSRLIDESVDVVVTSPPYNLGISYGKYSDRQNSQYRRRSIEPDAAPRDRDDVARVFRTAKPFLLLTLF